MSDPYPAVDPDPPWTETTRERTVLADPGPTTVVGYTVVYEDPAVAEAFSALDPSPTRFAFATALSFDPELTSGIGVATVRPTVVRAADRAFADRLRERGLTTVDRGRRDRLRTDTGDRARLRRFTGEYRPTSRGEESADPVAAEGFLAVWTVNGRFRIAGGAYPTSGRPDGVGSPGRYREDLLSVLRSVS